MLGFISFVSLSPVASPPIIVELVYWVLKKLSENGLSVNIDKGIFHILEVKFVGILIATQGIQISQKKVEDILNWPAPRSVTKVQKFIGFANFSR